MERVLRQALGGPGDQVAAGGTARPPRRILTSLMAVAGVLLLLSPAIGGEGRDLTSILERVPDDALLAEYSHPAWERLVELKETGVRSVGEEEWSRAQKDLDLVLEHLDRLKTEPFYPDFYRLRCNVRFHPTYKDYDYRVRTRFPWVVFVQSSDDESKADAVADGLLDKLEGIQAAFFRFFGEKIEFPAFEELAPGDRVLKLWIFGKRLAFHGDETGIRPGMVASYQLPGRWVLGHHDERETVERFRLGVGYCAAHQLIHLYRKVLTERQNKEILWTDNRLLSRCGWFDMGVAEFLAGKLKVRSDLLRRWGETRKTRQTEWRLADLLKIRTSGEMHNKAARKALGNVSEVFRLRRLYRAQAWAWVHFLYYSEGGKYRDKLLAYAEKEFHGVSGPEVFKKVWGAGDDYDWSPIEDEWRTWVESLSGK